MKTLNLNLAEQITLITKCGINFHRHSTNTYTENMVDTMNFKRNFLINNEIFELQITVPIQIIQSENTIPECQIWRPDRTFVIFNFSELKELQKLISPKQADWVKSKLN